MLPETERTSLAPRRVHRPRQRGRSLRSSARIQGTIPMATLQSYRSCRASAAACLPFRPVTSGAGRRARLITCHMLSAYLPYESYRRALYRGRGMVVTRRVEGRTLRLGSERRINDQSARVDGIEASGQAVNVARAPDDVKLSLQSRVASCAAMSVRPAGSRRVSRAPGFTAASGVCVYPDERARGRGRA